MSVDFKLHGEYKKDDTVAAAGSVAQGEVSVAAAGSVAQGEAFVAAAGWVAKGEASVAAAGSVAQGEASVAAAGSVAQGEASAATMGGDPRVAGAHASPLRDGGGGGGGFVLWQRNYYEHVIRDQKSMDRIREYIAGNPSRWNEDSLSPKAW